MQGGFMLEFDFFALWCRRSKLKGGDQCLCTYKAWAVNGPGRAELELEWSNFSPILNGSMSNLGA